MALLIQLPRIWLTHAILSLGGLTTTVSILYFIVRAIYRIIFHPLCTFPSPKLRAISHLPHAFAGAKGLGAVAARDLHRRYGEVVRIAPDLLSFMTPSSRKDIHGHAASKKFPKYGYFKVRADAQPLLTADDEDYPRQRAALAHGFSERAINGQEATLTQHINVFIEKLQTEAKVKQSVDMSEWFSFLTFDIIGEFTLGMQFGDIENSQDHPWVSVLVKWFRATSFAVNANASGILAPVVMMFADIKDVMGIKIHSQTSAERVRQRLEIGDDPSRRDIWTYVMRAQGDKSLTLAEMEVNAAALLVAATAPVSDTLCGAVYLLLGPGIKGYHHVDDNKNAIFACRHQRIFALLHANTWGGRRKTPPEGANISGYSVSGGTIVCVYQLPAFTLPNNFALPESFLPERWLPSHHPDFPKATVADKKDVFQPFSVGPKACLGMGLAYAEIKLILARLVWHFDLELVDDIFAFEKQKMYLFRERPALNVSLTLRSH